MLKADLTRSADRWLAYLETERRLRRSSVQTYRTTLRALIGPLPDSYTREDLRRSLDARLGERASSHVRRSTWVHAGLFFRWYEEHGGIENPLGEALAPPVPKVRRRALTDPEVNMLFERLRNADLKAKTALYLMLLVGFRCGDVVALRVADIDWQGGRLRAANGKGGLDAFLPMGPTMAGFLRAYLAQSNLTAGYVFTGPKGQMTVRGVWSMWRRVVGSTLTGCVPHMLRHTYATRLFREAGADLETVQHLMRHASPVTTMRYITHDEGLAVDAVTSLDEWAARKAGRG